MFQLWHFVLLPQKLFLESNSNVKIGYFIVSRMLLVIIPVMGKAGGSTAPICSDTQTKSANASVSNRKHTNYSKLIVN